jgi:hypothetical protein
MTEPELFTEPMPAAQPLPHRQDLVLRALIRLNGLTEDEAGQLLHGDNGKHSAEETCKWCAMDGRSVLRALRNKSLVTRRRDGHWTLPGDQAKREHERARAAAGPDTAPPARSWSRNATDDEWGGF